MADSLSHGISAARRGGAGVRAGDGDGATDGADGVAGDMAGGAAEAAAGDTPSGGGTGIADGLIIRGSVRDSLGVALPRAVVTLTAEAGGRPLAKTRSAQDGAFTVTAPAPGDYLLVAFSPQLGRQSASVRLTGQPVEVEFRMDVPGSSPS